MKTALFAPFCLKQKISLLTDSSQAVPEVSENQADFSVGGQNSITLPRSCGGSHFTRFENLLGM
jgi:hypothetical protein